MKKKPSQKLRTRAQSIAIPPRSEKEGQSFFDLVIAQAVAEHSTLTDLQLVLKEKTQQLVTLQQYAANITTLPIEGLGINPEDNLHIIETYVTEHKALVKSKKAVDNEIKKINQTITEQTENLEGAGEKIAHLTNELAAARTQFAQILRIEHDKEDAKIASLKEGSIEAQQALQVKILLLERELSTEKESIEEIVKLKEVAEQKVKEQTKANHNLHTKIANLEESLLEMETVEQNLETAQQEVTKLREEITELEAKNQEHAAYIKQLKESESTPSLQSETSRVSSLASQIFQASDSSESEMSGDEKDKVPPLTKKPVKIIHRRAFSTAPTVRNKPMSTTALPHSSSSQDSRVQTDDYVRTQAVAFVGTMMRSENLNVADKSVQIERLTENMPLQGLEVAIEYLIKSEPKLTASLVLVLDKYNNKRSSRHPKRDFSLTVDIDEQKPAHQLLAHLFPRNDDEKSQERTFNLHELGEEKKGALKEAASCLIKQSLYRPYDNSELETFLIGVTNQATAKNQAESLPEDQKKISELEYQLESANAKIALLQELPRPVRSSSWAERTTSTERQPLLQKEEEGCCPPVGCSIS
jgi:hypothetical protein